MISKMIEKKINLLTKEDIISFSKSENIFLNDSELDIIYNYIKKEWKTLIYGDSNPIFNELKNKVNINTYNKLLELYNFYKKKYQLYL